MSTRNSLEILFVFFTKMFSNMFSMAISSGRGSTDLFKGIKSKHTDEAFEFLLWCSSGIDEHSVFDSTLEFNMPTLTQAIKYSVNNTVIGMH